jgi:phytoene dehydrogenase-like protein
MRLAVIGTGIAGNAAAWLLSQRYNITVYERELRPGGHSHTVRIDYEGEPIDVDIGFIVFNELNYPELPMAAGLNGGAEAAAPFKPHPGCLLSAAISCHPRICGCWWRY